MEGKRTKRYYSQEYKIEIAKRCLNGESSKSVARATGTLAQRPEFSVLISWLRQPSYTVQRNSKYVECRTMR